MCPLPYNSNYRFSSLFAANNATLGLQRSAKVLLPEIFQSKAYKHLILQSSCICTKSNIIQTCNLQEFYNVGGILSFEETEEGAS